MSQLIQSNWNFITLLYLPYLPYKQALDVFSSGVTNVFWDILPQM